MAKAKHPITNRKKLAKFIKLAETMETADAKLLLPQVNVSMETAKTRLFREAKARQTAELILGQLFSWLKTNVGVEDAWRNFNSWTERARPQSLVGHRGPSHHQHQRYLLGVYDQLAEIANGKTGPLPRLIATNLHDKKPGEYGNSVDAIAKNIRRLLKEREARRANEAKVRAGVQGLIHELGWDVPKGSTNERRRNTSTKSRDK